MGKPSNTNPMRGQARSLASASEAFARLVTIGLLSGLAAQAWAQAATLPLVLPSAIVFDAQGNLYIADSGAHVVRRFSAAGVVSTVAGTGVQGFAGDGGPATAAELDSPMGLAMDAAGDLFIADSHNQRVREVVVATGVIATIAGTGAAGHSGDGGAATVAQLDLPTALAVDAAGNLYVADTENHRVRRIAAGTGVISTVAGDGLEGFGGDNGMATAAAIDSPNGLAIDAAGDLYIADTHNGRVREVNAATGVIATVAGVGVVGGSVQAFGGDGGLATAAAMALPRGLTMDAAGDLYVADSANHRIRRISGNGVIATVAGQGTEAFAGDGAPAVAASLDLPRSVAMSQAGLVTLADSGNLRVRQLDALPAPGPDIHTIAGLGTTAQDTVSLSGPSVVTYGSGSMTATLAAATNATGSVTFVDTSGGTPVTLGSVGLSSDVAAFSTGALAVGAHSIIAIYAGDANHGAAESSALVLTVTPQTVTVAINPASMLYGQTVPALSGTITGALAQDAGKVEVAFTTSATAASPPGSYLIAAMLTGSAAGNYAVVTGAAGSLTIARAPTLTVLSASTIATSPGLPVTLKMQAASTTSGVPTGSVTLLDGGAALSTLPLSSGLASFTTSSLASGTDALTASYSGDANFLPSTSPVVSVAVGAASDFTLTATGPTTQAIAEGDAATYSFSVALVGAALASPIALAVQGAPLGAISSLSPSYLPPGGAVTSFTLTIQTPPAVVNQPGGPLIPGLLRSGAQAMLAFLLLPAIGLAGLRRAKGSPPSTMRLAFAGLSCLLLATLASGCGNRVNSASEFANAMTYTITVTGTATGTGGAALVHSVNVTLQVQ